MINISVYSPSCSELRVLSMAIIFTPNPTHVDRLNLKVFTYTYIYMTSEENSMMSWSTNLYYYNHSTTKIFGEPVAFFSGKIIVKTTTIIKQQNLS